jgi:hypothetical protein
LNEAKRVDHIFSFHLQFNNRIQGRNYGDKAKLQHLVGIASNISENLGVTIVPPVDSVVTPLHFICTFRTNRYFLGQSDEFSSIDGGGAR